MAVSAADPSSIPKAAIPLTPGTTIHAPTAHIKISGPKPVAPIKDTTPKAPGLKFQDPNLRGVVNNIAPGGQVSPQQFAAQQTAKSQSTLNQYLNYLGTNMGRVPPINYAAIGKQANSELEGMVSPLLQGYNQQLTAGTQAINQYTGQLATQLGNIGTQIGGIYNQAEQQQSALDTAIQAELAGNGGQQAAALQTALQNAGQSTAPAAQEAASATGIAGAQYAEGSASLASLLGQGAAAQAYGATLPGIARLSGLQALGSLQGSIGTAEQKAIDTAEGKYPTLVNQLTNQALGAQKNAISQQKNQTAAQLAREADAIRQQTANATTLRAKAAVAQGNARIAISQQNANTSAARAATAKAQGDARVAIAQQNANTSAGRLALARSKQANGGGALTANEQINAVKAWNNPKSTSVRVPAFKIDPTTGKPTTTPAVNSAGAQEYTLQTQPGVVPPYSEQINRLVAAGVPRARAIAVVNSQVPIGQAGRPYQTISQALSTIQTNVEASIANGHSASDTYRAALATGVFPASLHKALAFTINRLYTQDYLKANPGSTTVPVSVSTAGK